MPRVEFSSERREAVAPYGTDSARKKLDLDGITPASLLAMTQAARENKAAALAARIEAKIAEVEPQILEQATQAAKKGEASVIVDVERLLGESYHLDGAATKLCKKFREKGWKMVKQQFPKRGPDGLLQMWNCETKYTLKWGK